MQTASAMPRPSIVPALRHGCLEVAALAIAWQLYRYGRFLVREQPDLAFDNSNRIESFEGFVGLDLVHGAQNLVIDSDTLIGLINRYYVYTHVALTILCLAWLFTRHREHYRHVRTALVLGTGFGLLVHGAFPLAPPRLQPDTTLVDTLMVHGPSVYSADEFESITNQFAAMPSFHVGWSVLMAIAVVTASSSRWRWLALAHPAIMTFAVMATANHYLTDGIVGAGIVVGALVIARRLSSGRDRTETVSSDGSAGGNDEEPLPEPVLSRPAA